MRAAGDPQPEQPRRQQAGEGAEPVEVELAAVAEVQAERRERRSQDQRGAAHDGLGGEEVVHSRVRERADRRGRAVAHRRRGPGVVDPQRRAQCEQRSEHAGGEEQDRAELERGHGRAEGFPPLSALAHLFVRTEPAPHAGRSL
jgi:hypothetical protein